MTTTTLLLAGTGETLDRVATASAWVNPGFITADDTSYATTTASTADGSDYLIARNFGFTVPTGASITGVVVIINGSEHSSGSEAVSLRLQNASATLVGTTMAVTFSGTGKTDYTAGASTNDWAASLTPDIVNNANFGVRAWFLTAHNVEVDYVKMQLTYVETHSASGAATLATVTAAGTATHVPKPVWTVTGAVSLPTVQVAQPTPAEELRRLPRLRWVPAKGGVYRRRWTVETVWDVIEGWRPGTTVIEAVGTTKTVTGAVTLSSFTVAGTAVVGRSASGAITLDSPTVAGTAERVVTASGTILLTDPTVAGTAERVVTASGAVLLPGITVDGTAERIVTASGAALLEALTVAGAASVTRSASGAITLSITVDGTALHIGEVTHTVTGAALLDSPAVAGTAAVARTASGTIVLTSPTVAGTALHVPEVVHDASGTVILPDPAVVGSAAVTRHASGAITLALTVDGDASISGQVVASGAITLDSPTVAGAAVVGRYVTGAITLDDLTVAGVALLAGQNVVTGTVTLDDPTVAAAAIVGRTASGAVTLDDPTVAGAATVISGAAYAETPAGRGGARRRRRYVVEIDGREFVVEGLQEAQSLLGQAQQLARVAAERQAAQAEARALPQARKLGRVPEIRLTPPDIRGPEDLRAELEAAQAAIRAAFDEAALEAELRTLLAWQQERDDEEALLLSL